MCPLQRSTPAYICLYINYYYYYYNAIDVPGNWTGRRRGDKGRGLSLSLYYVYICRVYLNISRRHSWYTCIGYYYIVSFWRHLVSMRAFANLNDRTLKLICGEKNSRQVPLSFPLSLSRLVSVSMTHTHTHTHIYTDNPCINALTIHI